MVEYIGLREFNKNTEERQSPKGSKEVTEGVTE